MPDRYTITANEESLQKKFGVEVPPAYRQRYNVSPAQLVPVITSQGSEGFSWFYWGTIPGWTGGNKSISSKILHIQAQDLTQKAAFKRMLDSQRCVVPADGFYLWKRVGKKSRIPHRFVMRDRSVFAFAGIWEEFEDEKDQVHHTFRLVQSTLPSDLDAFDDMMPVILDDEGIQKWLNKNTSSQELMTVLEPFPTGKLEYYTVSAKIEDISLDKPSLISPAASMNQFGNYSLFD